MIRLSILGSTGTIGKNALDVVRAHKDKIQLVGIGAYRASKELLEEVKEFRPKFVFSVETPTKDWLDEVSKYSKYLDEEEGLQAIIENSDRILNAISGTSGIKATYNILKAKKILLASNKESILCMPNLIRENLDLVIPVDSEHNAAFELLKSHKTVKNLYITASGGPFREYSKEQLKTVSKEEALKHPNWKMGPKITIDSATLMNKGFELIEASVLFNIPLERIKILIHPQSIVHAIVELENGSFIANMSLPDMRLPIQNAIFYPEMVNYTFNRLDLTYISCLSFEKPKRDLFRAIDVCEWVASMGNPYVSVLLGADDKAVELFLEGKIGFLDIPVLIENVLSSVNFHIEENLEDILRAVEFGKNKLLELSNHRM
ncbi:MULTISPECIES: 1-deoxy-D-xylulose-5-phosphate reductoisomerase [unclassified Hydrogenobaculum]|uniref:1-deoxy-D-xylulose-5-phosphate reductoisomerase n=1 Tax=unclassified Hydrogenobaculum TaxID=2622382 RepID=UPI0001C502B2|nr:MULTISPECIES: 1-deoxy-D-xylulose-5-phosphate reductoisomerase [unclassified Hydrogenobaculum]AEF18504.1 1-deoxy-D-xylulose 5-phosphate reductoisomerase [Hydrogenobaculum sp. 3684]AEG45794.1 1-deoxy-D-xylulose 5-phosphate reductoisomerase [Hydrogenobaculum sp. SHO]AGG14435.1 1-deoxy-D-xylulose 5-phosphate reductoisomerase [Hydrogenobaculum sp. HO]AGH92740.1 1-deoxy-D-xylulose 5-phosphate reductoisomerase [Hydrogenobaculum sp. SN]